MNSDLLEEISNTGLAANKLNDLALASHERNTRTLRNYADLLYDSILNEMLPRRDQILEELEDAIRNGRPQEVKLWTYSVTYHTGLDRETMADLAASGHHTVIFDDERPMSVDRIVQHTDILWRLAFTFGTHFRVTRRRGYLRACGEDREGYEMELWLEYVSDLTEDEANSLVAAYKSMRNRPMYQGSFVRMTARF